ncbi:alpha-1,2-fucosyltransferase [Candidatus Laterigemmans baculatus]|uniref:alpha-1,2-fucosyltransferase n=1 Tax=Candidatus Laterigemmans baculatus TaxID=2770505 RepID=UPI001F328767|nr:alpha-1,2-fucosyltransferase [Candidatus Laterigemmans baculatus]
MLQYAAGRAVSLRCGCPLELDLSFYDRKRHRSFELSAFPIHAHRRPSNRGWQRILGRAFRQTDPAATVYRESSKAFDPCIRSLEAPVRLDGYFFSEKYFSDHAETIRSELTPPEFSDAGSLELKQRMASTESTALHVRRGDYVTNKNASERFWSCSLEYYEEAIDRVPSRGEVFVFSDDIPWARKNLRSSKPLVFVGEGSNHQKLANAGLRDLWLMTHADHHIIANSSFSWWGAWLADAGKGLKIAPRKWFNDPTIDDSDIIPERWLRI